LEEVENIFYDKFNELLKLEVSDVFL